MRHIIVATHSTMAEGLCATVQFILGDQENLSFLCAYTGACMDFKQSLQKELDRFAPQEEVIILTDLFGGSVNNDAMQFLDRENIYVTAGVNLALLIQILSADEHTPACEVISEAVENARAAILFCNPLSQNTGSEELDDF